MVVAKSVARISGDSPLDNFGVVSRHQSAGSGAANSSLHPHRSPLTSHASRLAPQAFPSRPPPLRAWGRYNGKILSSATNRESTKVLAQRADAWFFNPSFFIGCAFIVLFVVHHSP
jgi:hypothetical protein